MLKDVTGPCYFHSFCDFTTQHLIKALCFGTLETGD